jgi:hypothetical protein
MPFVARTSNSTVPLKESSVASSAGLDEFVGQRLQVQNFGIIKNGAGAKIDAKLNPSSRVTSVPLLSSSS